MHNLPQIVFLCLMLIPYSAKYASGSTKSIPGSYSTQQEVMYKELIGTLKSNSILNISWPCMDQLLSPKMKSLAIYYLDAMGKPGSAYITGNYYWPGSYDECESIPDSQYCLTDVQLPLSNISMAMLGICAPAQCNEDDIIDGFNMLAKQYKISKYVYIPKDKGLALQYGKNMYCPKKAGYPTGTIVVLVLCGVILTLCLVGTVAELVNDMLTSEKPAANKSEDFMPVQVHDDEEDSPVSGKLYGDDLRPLIGFKQKKRTTIVDVLTSFSLIKNTKLVVNADVPKGAVTSLNGMRVLSMWWVVLGHTEAFIANALVSDNSFNAVKVVQRFTFLPIDNGYYSVDSFFFLSGLLVAYLSMRRFDKYGKLPLLPFYVHRFLRLTPVYMFVILFFTNIFPLLGSGPLWSFVSGSTATKPCVDYWWTNLLYINNFYPTDQAGSCIGWSWYLANDMQFYVISPVFLYIMYRFKLLGGVLSIGFTLVASFIATGVLFGYYHLNPFLTDAFIDPAMAPETAKFMKYTYIKPYCRIAPYLVGMLTGYVLHNKMKLRGNLKWVIALIGWAVAVVLGTMLTYGTWPYFKEGKVEPSDFVKIAYGTFSRFVWGVALAWVVYACHFGFGGLINKFLSWKAFAPLSRLTYGTYLVHLIVLELFYYGRSSAIHYTDMQAAIYFMATIVTSYACAFVLAVCVEMPFANLEKLVFKF